MKTKALLWAICLLLACACSPSANKTGSVRSMYYWSTVFKLDSTKQHFLNSHRVSRLYVRYFDVVLNNQGEPMPNATIRFQSAMPEGADIIPTIFIVNDCMRRSTEGLADKLLTRILQMNETHHIDRVGEIQIDCDWTRQTRKAYYAFLEELRQKMHAKGLKLSVTIRLHQLSHPVPPADSGVLMMYNTGDHTDLNCEKPILDVKTALPYLPQLASYKLPLASAYPLYRWDIVFRHGRYVGIQHYEGELPVLSTDTIVVRQPDLTDIMQARNAVSRKRPDANNEIILFDLTNPNIQRYKPQDYEKMFSD